MRCIIGARMVLASFMISDLSVTPGEVGPAEPVTVTAVVNSNGGNGGSCTVVLKVDGAEEARKEVSLLDGKSETVTFTIERDRQGSHVVNINGKVAWFSVTPAPVPAIPASVKTQPQPLQPQINWSLIGIVIAGCVVLVVGSLTYFIMRRSRDALRSSASKRKKKRAKVGPVYSFLPRWKL